MRNSVLRIAAGGQEVIKINDVGVDAVADRYAKKEEDKIDGRQDASDDVKKAVDDSLKDAKAAKDSQADLEGKNESAGEKWTLGMPQPVIQGDNKKPIL